MRTKILLFGAAVCMAYGTVWAQTTYGGANGTTAGNGGGNTNSYFGDRAGRNNTAGSNTFIGYFSGLNNTLGSNNTFLGTESGRLNNTGSGNVFLGFNAGYNETGSNLLYIHNSDTASPLIWGNFAANILNFNGNVGIDVMNPTAALDVNGAARIRSIAQNNALTRILATDIDGNISWRDAATLGGGGTDDQQLSLAGNLLQLEDGGFADLSPYLDNTDNQNLQLIGSALSISGGNVVDLSPLSDGTGTDDQQLSLAGNQLQLEDGGNVDLSTYLDNTDSQNLQLIGNTLSITNGNAVDLSSLGGGTDDQQLSLVGNQLQLEDGGNVDLSLYLDNTDSQDLSVINAGTNRTINITDGLGVNFSVADNDDNSANEIQSLDFAGNIITLSNDPAATAIDLSGYDSNAADDFDGNFASLSNVPAGLADGDDVNDADADATNEIQSLDFTGNIITLSNDPAATAIDLSGYDSNAADDFSGSFNDLSNVPANLDLDATDDFDGNFASLSNVPAGLADGDDVNDADADPGNEYNTVFQVNGANLEITDNGGTLSIPLADLDTGMGTFPSYPESAGDGGNNTNSYFGHEAGSQVNDFGYRNTFIGHQSGLSNTNADDNTFIGYRSGVNTTSSDNVFIGSYSGENHTNGFANTFVGYRSGRNTTNASDGNTFLGYQSGLNNIGGDSNTFLGTNSGSNNGDGDQNTFVGNASGYNNNSYYNTFIGSSSGHGNVSGTNNTFLGYHSGRNHNSGDDNTFIGDLSGENNDAGSGNVFIGHQAGRNETGSDLLYIDNSSTSSPLIWGDFGTDELRFNGTVAIGANQTPVAGYHLTVGGDIIAEKVKVAVNGSANWSDYVFEEDYDLKPLSEVETFVKENKHLPGIPSAEEMVKEGLDVAQMDAKLLEKIEELTLYMIEMKKEIEMLKKENTALKATLVNPKQ